jgi:SAM-dependent methyltransferase
MSEIKDRIRSMLIQSPAVRSAYSHFRPTLWGYGTRPTYMDDFIDFVAQRRQLSSSDARALVTQANEQFAGGWGGDQYRQFTESALETFRPLYDDRTDAEVIATYQFHHAFDFLRMLGYAVPTVQDMEPVLSRLAGRQTISLVDYGFGLAHRTIAISRYLQERGAKVTLYLIDIRKELHLAFVDYLCRKHGIDHEFIEITADNLYPELPPCDYCDNVSVLEHIREPVTVVNNTDRALRPGGLFMVLIEDAIEEMMHLSPNLRPARDRLAELNYQRVGTCYGTPLYQKPLA